MVVLETILSILCCFLQWRSL